MQGIPLETLDFLATMISLAGTGAGILGEHYFSGSGQPSFDLRFSGDDDWATMKKVASANAPKSVDVPWLKLDGIDGVGIKVCIASVFVLVCPLSYMVLTMVCRKFIVFIRLAVLVRLRARDTRVSLRWSMRRSIGSMDDDDTSSEWNDAGLLKLCPCASMGQRICSYYLVHMVLCDGLYLPSLLSNLNS